VRGEQFVSAIATSRRFHQETAECRYDEPKRRFYVLVLLICFHPETVN
jgi:hypothetical protein